MRNKRSNYSVSKESGCRRILGVSLVISLALLLTCRNSKSKSVSNLSKTFLEDSTTDLFGTENHSKELFDGLLPLQFDSKSCLSRYESHLYRKSSPHKPSSHLISKLRDYERLHKRCGPESTHYNRMLTKYAITREIEYTEECKYIVGLPINGLGNRMMSLASTFLYAILTNRVLLVAFEDDMSGLFCEPFLGSTWQLPHDFPHMHDNIDDLPTYASLVKSVIGMDNATKLANSMPVPVPSFVHVNLQQRTGWSPQYEKFFHCGEGQMILNQVPILILSSNQYYAPSLFMVPSFERDLNEMFPEKDTVFHHLGRYLYNPSNEGWSQITRFYKANLSKANKKVGIQVRVVDVKLKPAKMVMKQILACTLNNNILPRVEQMKSTSSSMAVLVTSLQKEYSENLSAFYKAEEAIQVYQPSHEKVQRFNNNTHNLKALTEMYLLSLCDELVTTGRSSFGYVAQGLGGLKPWIMHRGLNDTELWDPPCERALSMEPCYVFAPRYDCERRIEVEHISWLKLHMRRCEDSVTGVKMVVEP